MKIQITNDNWVEVTKDKDGNILLRGDEFDIWFKNDWLSKRWFTAMVIDIIRILDKEQRNKIAKEMQ
jgi:hypothetical protein